MKIKLLILAAIMSFPAIAQTNYVGTVGGEKITFSTDAYRFSDGVTAVYSMGEDPAPYWMNGYLEQGILELREYLDGEILTVIKIQDFNEQKESLRGEMTFMGSGETFELKLERLYSLSGDEGTWENQRLEQVWCFDDYYFALLTSKTEDDYYARVTGILMFNNDHDLLQEISGIDCSAVRGYHSVEIDDYNFDGSLDFSVFQEQYAGANTMRIYYLYNEDTEQFEYSEDLSYLMSAQFDQETSIVIERNQMGEAEVIIYYGFDQNGELLRLNMLPEEGPAYKTENEGEWRLTDKQEGEFDSLIKRGTLTFHDENQITVSFDFSRTTYTVTYDEQFARLKNVKKKDDILTFTVEEVSPTRMVWTRLENDVFSTWIMTK